MRATRFHTVLLLLSIVSLCHSQADSIKSHGSNLIIQSISYRYDNSNYEYYFKITVKNIGDSVFVDRLYISNTNVKWDIINSHYSHLMQVNTDSNFNPKPIAPNQLLEFSSMQIIKSDSNVVRFLLQTYGKKHIIEPLNNTPYEVHLQH